MYMYIYGLAFTFTLTPPAVRLDNLIYSAAGDEVLAVLDWELSTLGDPVSDLAYTCMQFHMDPGQPHLKGQCTLQYRNVS